MFHYVPQIINTQNSEVGWLEFNVPFQHKYGYIRDEHRIANKYY